MWAGIMGVGVTGAGLTALCQVQTWTQTPNPAKNSKTIYLMCIAPILEHKTHKKKIFGTSTCTSYLKIKVKIHH